MRINKKDLEEHILIVWAFLFISISILTKGEAKIIYQIIITFVMLLISIFIGNKFGKKVTRSTE